MITGILGSVLGFILAVGILVAFHEYGHYWVARRLGVKVLRYSIGFGKPLLTWRRGPDQTEYCLSAIPLGGYVRMLDGREDAVAPEERHRAFDQQPLWRRTAIVAAGPGANFLFAIVVYWLLFVAGTSELRPTLGLIAAETPAAEAGLVEGDHVLAIDGRQTPTWDRVLINLMDGALRQGSVSVLVDRDGREQTFTLDLSGLGRLGDDPDLLGSLGMRPWRPAFSAEIGTVIAGGAADAAGLHAGDRIVAIDGMRTDTWNDLLAVLPALAGERVEIALVRDGRERRVPVQLDDPARGRGILGINPSVPDGAFDGLHHTVRYGPVESLGRAVSDTWQASVLTLTVLWKMVVGEASLNNLSGPISIGQYAGDTAASGLVPFLKFLAIISISLGLLNLLPIPVLDGGHLMYFAYEGVTGVPPSERAQIIGQQIGLFMLLLLMMVAFYNDIGRLVGGW